MAVTSDGTPYVEPGDAISAYPVVSQELAAVIDSLRTMIPAGAIFPYAGKLAPEGYLMCDGKAYNRGDFFDLYNVMAEWVGQWGGFPNGDSTLFFVPDMRGRAPFGVSGNAEAGDDKVLEPLSLGSRSGDARVPYHIHLLTLPHGPLAGDPNTTPPTPGIGAFADGGVGAEWPTPLAMGGAYWNTNLPERERAMGLSRNLSPATAVNFIVWTGTTTTGKNPVPGVELPSVTTRMMIEARLEEAGIGEEEIEMLREQLAALKEDTDG